MKFFFLSLLVVFTGIANATDYYVSTAGNDANNGTSEATPWKTLNKIHTVGNNGTLKAGDKVMFRKGDTFTGFFFMTNLWGHDANSGTATNPITFTSYGTGAKPIMQYPQGGSVTPAERIIFWFIGVNYIVVDGLNFTDVASPTNDKMSPANIGFAIYLGAQGEAKTNNCTIKNIDVSLCGMGICVIGDFNTITTSTFTNFKNLKNTSGGTDDYGATAFTIMGNDNQILNNYISGAWAYSYDYAWNGGAVEMYDECSRNKIMYNTIVDCEGVSEFGAQDAQSAADNLYAYNKIVNCGQLIWINTSGQFGIQVSNVQYYNNVIVENSLSRFSGPNVGAGNSHPDAQYPCQQLFAFGGTPNASVVFNLKNNIFHLSTGIDVVGNSHASKTTHQDNIYKLTGGGNPNYTLATSELSTTAAVLTSTTASDPLSWNYAPISGSPAIDFGQNVGITKDFAGTTVPSVPNAGILESGGSAPPSTLAVSATAGSISCYGGTATVTVTASGGTTPYTGTGNFTKAAGTYTFSVTDAAGTVKTTSVTLAQPTALSGSVSAPNVSSSTAKTTATVTASGGTTAYTYNLDGGAYQSSNVFLNVAVGSHSITIKDAKGCTLAKAFTVSVTATTLAVSSSAGTISCNGGTTTVTVTASGGIAPYVGTGNFTKAAGTYTFSVTDAAGSVKTTTITISQPTALSGSVSAPNVSSSTAKTTATVTASGGTPAYTYKIDAGAYQSSNVFTNVAVGSHSITIKDAKGCTLVKSFTVSVTAPAPLVVSASAGTILCFNGSTTVTVTATGGTAPYTGTGTFTATAGTRTFTVTDANGTSASKTLTLVQPVKITATLTRGVISVPGGSTSVRVNPVGGTAPYTFKLNSGSYQTSSTFPVVYGGANTITIKDSRGCLKVKNFNLAQPTSRSADADYVSKGGAGSTEKGSVELTEEFTGFRITAFPNPTTSEFSLIVENNRPEKIQIVVMNVNGQRVYEGRTNANQVTRFGANFLPGIYFVKVMQGTTVQTIKVIKSNS